MSQHDYILDNASGAAFRSDANNALGAIVSLNSGAAAPATTYAYMLWADTTNNLLKQRNAGNSAWVIRNRLDAEGLVGKTAHFAVALGDFGKVFDVTASTFVVSTIAAATAGDGFMFGLRNSGSGIITLKPGSGGLIDGASTTVFKTGESAIIWTDGTKWRTIGRLANVTAARLLGNSSSAAARPQEISVGTGLSLAAGSLTCTVTGSGWKLIQSKDLSTLGAQGSLTFSGIVASTYAKYALAGRFQAVTDGVIPKILLKMSTVFASTGYAGYIEVWQAGAAPIASVITNSFNMLTGGSNARLLGNDATDFAEIYVDFDDLAVAKTGGRYWKYNLRYIGSEVTGNPYHCDGLGTIANGKAVTHVMLKLSSGNLAGSGWIGWYGLKKA